jgi:hypothetical protein
MASQEMRFDRQWCLSLDKNSNIRDGVDLNEEKNLRIVSSRFVQQIGENLRISQLTINTAIVYLQRFYLYHSFYQFHYMGLACSSIFLASKVSLRSRPKDPQKIKVFFFSADRGKLSLN